MQNRFNQLDALKGLGMILVIIGHMDLSLVGSSIGTFIYTFHMPLFFLVSGYLSIKIYPNFWGLIKKKSKSLLLPYTVLFLISLFFGYILVPFVVVRSNIIPDVEMIQIIKSYLFSGGELEKLAIYNFPLWFLPCMFVTELCFHFLKRIKNDLVLAGVLIVIAALTFPFQTIVEGRPPFHINVLPAALVCMGIGYLFRKYESHIKSNNFINGILALVIIVLAYKNPGNISYIMNPLFFFVSASLITYLFYSMFINVTSKNLLVYIGGNSLIIFGIHSLVILWYTFLPISSYFANYNGVALFSINIFFIILICLLIVWLYSFVKVYLRNIKKAV